MGKSKKPPNIGKVIKADDGYGIIGKIGRKLFGRKTGWDDPGQYNGPRTDRRGKGQNN